MTPFEELQQFIGPNGQGSSYPVNIPTWKIAELSGLSTRSVQKAMKLGKLDHTVEAVFAWLRSRR